MHWDTKVHHEFGSEWGRQGNWARTNRSHRFVGGNYWLVSFKSCFHNFFGLLEQFMNLILKGRRLMKPLQTLVLWCELKRITLLGNFGQINRHFSLFYLLMRVILIPITCPIILLIEDKCSSSQDHFQNTAKLPTVQLKLQRTIFLLQNYKAFRGEVMWHLTKFKTNLT